MAVQPGRAARRRPRALVARHPAIPRLALPVSRRLVPDTVQFVQPAFYPELPFTALAAPGERGLVTGVAGACGKTLVLTGTLLGGYASTLFHLLYRFSPAIRAEFAHSDEAKWVARYGYLARITKRDPDARADDGRQSKRHTYLTRVVEKPGVTPAILFQLVGNTVFLRLRDVAKHLPAYEEQVLQVPLSLRANLDAQRAIMTRSLCARVSAESERGLPSPPTSLPRHRLRRSVGVGERSPTPRQDSP